MDRQGLCIDDLGRHPVISAALAGDGMQDQSEAAKRFYEAVKDFKGFWEDSANIRTAYDKFMAEIVRAPDSGASKQRLVPTR